MRAGELVLGVSSAPLYGELAWAERGSGAFLNDKSVRVSGVARLEDAFISSGNLRSLARSPTWRRFGALLGRAACTRGYGDFVHYHLLARGGVDVVIESDVNILDIAALAVLVREAGGVFTDLTGASVGLDTRSVRAAELDHRRDVELAQRGTGERRGRRSERPAAIAEQQQRAIGEPRGERRIVQCRDHGSAAVRELPEKAENGKLMMGIEMVGRLIEEKNRGLLCEE